MSPLRPLLVVLTLHVAASAMAEPLVFHLDPEATTISFELGATLHTVHGTVGVERGEVRFDPQTGTASGAVEVESASAETGNSRRDRDMHEKVLESSRYPAIVFRPSGFTGELTEGEEAQVALEGSLEIHGGSHPLRLTVGAWLEGGRLSARTRFVVPYVAWGLKDPSKLLLRVAKEVTVEVETSGQLSRP